MTAHSMAAMLEATQLTRSGKLADAVALIQATLGGAVPAPPDPAPRFKAPTGRLLEIDPETGELVQEAAARPQPAAPDETPHPETRPGQRNFFRGPDARGTVLRRKGTDTPALPGEFQSLAFALNGAKRDYRLYVPKHRPDGPMPLVVMLHGCTQSPEDFAAGTRMNELAEQNGVLVAYPAQPSSANAQKCWNWFNPNDQARDKGEPALLAGIARAVVAEHGADPARIYVAGLSAGGAAAAILGRAYPDLFAAIGVHSGLASGAAHDVMSAFAAMREGDPGHPGATQSRTPPAIVFHADRDNTVHPRNGEAVAAQFNPRTHARTERHQGQVPGGHSFTRTIHHDGEGNAALEQWLVHGGGHAWSGGSPAGSYTDPRGPDASREMLRFFLQHRLS